jgi:hypothetical protein
VSYSEWLTWAASYEATAFTGFTGNQISQDAYDVALEAFYGLENYIGVATYRTGVYNLAMHNLILKSNLCAAPMTTLYTKYHVATRRQQGVLQSASNDRTSSTRVIPSAVQDGDAAMMLLWATPYGQEVEALFEQIRPYVTVIQ